MLRVRRGDIYRLNGPVFEQGGVGAVRPGNPEFAGKVIRGALGAAADRDQLSALRCGEAARENPGDVAGGEDAPGEFRSHKRRTGCNE